LRPDSHKNHIEKKEINFKASDRKFKTKESS